MPRAKQRETSTPASFKFHQFYFGSPSWWATVGRSALRCSWAFCLWGSLMRPLGPGYPFFLVTVSATVAYCCHHSVMLPLLLYSTIAPLCRSPSHVYQGQVALALVWTALELMLFVLALYAYKEHRFWNPEDSRSYPDPAIMSCVTLGNLLNHSEPEDIFMCKMGLTPEHTSKGCCEV